MTPLFILSQHLIITGAFTELSLREGEVMKHVPRSTVLLYPVLRKVTESVQSTEYICGLDKPLEVAVRYLRYGDVTVDELQQW